MQNIKTKVLGTLAYYVGKILKMTLRIRVVSSPFYDPEKKYLFAFWHGKQLLPVLQLQSHRTPRAVLISPSRDGDLLAVWLKKLGFDCIRGSSRRENVSALAGMIRKLRQGYSLGFGIDGPIGPIYKVKPGMTHLSQKFQIPIIPVGSAFEKSWILEKAWDKYAIPKPFSRAVFYLGDPIQIAIDEDLSQANLQLEENIKRAEAEAQALI